jgi:hypothetical protein
METMTRQPEPDSPLECNYNLIRRTNMKPETIKALKENEKPFGLMSAELQEAAKEIGKAKFQWFSAGWMPAGPTNILHSNHTYRLRPDYQPESDVVEYPISVGSDGILGFLYGKNAFNTRLNCAIEQPDFIGFKFEDGRILPTPIKYSGAGIQLVTGKHDDSEVLHATHVLFRRAK